MASKRNEVKPSKELSRTDSNKSLGESGASKFDDVKPVAGRSRTDSSKSQCDSGDSKKVSSEPGAPATKAVKKIDAAAVDKSESGSYSSASDSEDVDSVCEDLHRELKLSADAESEIQKVLVLLDFNGTLVFRDKDKSIARPKADYIVGHSQFFIRPFARELVCYLVNDPRCKVGNYCIDKSACVSPYFHFERLQSTLQSWPRICVQSLKHSMTTIKR
jgi:hypothetical protein